MLNTQQLIKQVEAISLQHFDDERRARKSHVFVDLSNVAIGAQVGPDGRRDTSVRINVPALVRCVHQDRDVKGRHLITSVGGTLDKMGVIPAYRVDPDIATFRKVVKEEGCAIIGQTADLAPADRRL